MKVQDLIRMTVAEEIDPQEIELAVKAQKDLEQLKAVKGDWSQPECERAAKALGRLDAWATSFEIRTNYTQSQWHKYFEAMARV